MMNSYYASTESLTKAEFRVVFNFRLGFIRTKNQLIFPTYIITKNTIIMCASYTLYCLITASAVALHSVCFYDQLCTVPQCKNPFTVLKGFLVQSSEIEIRPSVPATYRRTVHRNCILPARSRDSFKYRATFINNTQFPYIHVDLPSIGIGNAVIIT